MAQYLKLLLTTIVRTESLPKVANLCLVDKPLEVLLQCQDQNKLSSINSGFKEEPLYTFYSDCVNRQMPHDQYLQYTGSLLPNQMVVPIHLDLGMLIDPEVRTININVTVRLPQRAQVYQPSMARRSSLSLSTHMQGRRDLSSYKRIPVQTVEPPIEPDNVFKTARSSLDRTRHTNLDLDQIRYFQKSRHDMELVIPDTQRANKGRASSTARESSLYQKPANWEPIRLGGSIKPPLQSSIVYTNLFNCMDPIMVSSPNINLRTFRELITNNQIMPPIRNLQSRTRN